MPADKKILWSILWSPHFGYHPRVKRHRTFFGEPRGRTQNLESGSFLALLSFLHRMTDAAGLVNLTSYSAPHPSPQIRRIELVISVHTRHCAPIAQLGDCRFQACASGPFRTCALTLCCGQTRSTTSTKTTSLRRTTTTSTSASSRGTGASRSRLYRASLMSLT